MLVNTGQACQLMTFFIGITKICFLKAPVGSCRDCCPRDDVTDIQFKLYTRSNPTWHQVLPTSGNARLLLQGTNFDPNQQTVIYLMGFSESVEGLSTTTVRNAFLATGNTNFIAVDWARLIAFPWYPQAVSNTRYMGRRLADFIQFLDSSVVRATNLHVIGFSLGAEAAGFAGKELRRRGLLLGRITGLDPAYPGYGLNSNDGHLAQGDAAFVDVIHTNPGIFGFPNPIGDVDFYPNHGNWIQPGCWVDQLIRNNEIGYIYGCSHNRAWRYYAESVLNPFGFPSTLCRDWTSATRSCSFQINGYMGHAAAPGLSGKMYLLTNQAAPFARNGP